MEEISAWLIERQCPRNNNVFSFAVLVEHDLSGIKFERQINVIRLKAKLDRLLASGYTFDGDTLETVVSSLTKEKIGLLGGSTAYFHFEASIIDVFIEAGCPVTEKFFGNILGALPSIPESERLKIVRKIHSCNCPRPPLAVSIACAKSETTRDTQVLKFLLENGYEVTPDLTPQRLLEVVIAVSSSGVTLR